MGFSPSDDKRKVMLGLVGVIAIALIFFGAFFSVSNGFISSSTTTINSTTVNNTTNVTNVTSVTSLTSVTSQFFTTDITSVFDTTQITSQFTTTIQTQITSNSCTTNKYAVSINASGFLGCMTQTAQIIARDYKLGLVGYWPFDSTFAGSATSIFSCASLATCTNDVSGYTNTGTLINSPILTNGKFNNALNFSSASSQYVLVGVQSPLKISVFTICAYIYYDAAATTENIFSYGDHGWQFDLNSNKHVEIQESGVGGIVTGNIVLSANTWYFVCGSYDGSAGVVYVNGVLDNANGAVFSGLVYTHGLWIGGNPSYGQYFNGKIDEPRIYNLVYSSNEILNLYNYYQDILSGV